MKFDKVNRKQDWPVQKTYQRRSLVMKELADINRSMNSIDGTIRHLQEQKRILARKASNKWKYIRQLTEQIKEGKQRFQIH